MRGNLERAGNGEQATGVSSCRLLKLPDPCTQQNAMAGRSVPAGAGSGPEWRIEGRAIDAVLFWHRMRSPPSRHGAVRFGFRTAREIETERAAARALRCDFAGVPAAGGGAGAAVAQAIEAAER